MHPFFKNPLAVLSALCWFVIACLAVSVMLNTRTIENIDIAQNRAQADRDLLKRDIAQARDDTAQAARALARETAGMAQTQAAEAQDLRDSVAQLRNELSTLKRAVDDNRIAAERTSAALHAQLNRQKPVTFANARSIPSAHGIHFDGNGGRDTVKGWKPLLYLDGSLLVSVEVFNLADGRRNDVRVMAPGLNDLEDDFMELRLDPALDSVLLDRCLAWKKDDAPISDDLKKKFDTAPGAYIWTATDADGKTRRVAITAEADVRISDTCDNDYAAQVAARDAREKDMPKPKLPREEQPQPYTPDYAESARIYNDWAAATENQQIKDALTLVATMVQARKLPPDFLTGQGVRIINENSLKRTLRRLPLDPASLPLQVVKKDYNCEAQEEVNRQSGLHFSNSVDTICTGNGSLKIGSDGLQVILAGKGTERLDTNATPSLLILNKNWGSKTLYKTCRDPGSKRDEHIFRLLPSPATVFSGIGLRLAQDGGGGVVSAGTMPGSPAEKAGIAAGDRVVAINGEPLPPALADVVALIRGEAGTRLMLGIETRNGDKRDVALQREKITDTDSRATRQRIDYQWPYPFEDFILFGPGIRQGDLTEETPGKWRNVQTGDTLEISPCFNFVFSE